VHPGEVQRLLGRQDVLPGMVAAIQTHGELLHWHPHIHALVTCGAFTPEGEFLEVPELDLERLQRGLAGSGVSPCTWPRARSSRRSSRTCAPGRTAASARTSRCYLPAGDRAGIERLVQYMTRCPFSLSRLVKVTATGQVIYKAEKDACRAFPDPQGDGLASGPKRNFQILDPRWISWPSSRSTFRPRART
jgi:hypothetical protein